MRLLDCSCGIGTQAIGLARQGYFVTGSDLSPQAIWRAQREAETRRLTISFEVADMRSLATDVAGSFDVVVSIDNAISHLQDDHDLRRACTGMYLKMRPDGLLLISIRDYDLLLAEKPSCSQPMVFDHGARVVFQIWDWADHSNAYTVHQFILQCLEGTWTTRHFSTEYRALRQSEASSILAACGFSEITWHAPEHSGFYQPIVSARKR